MLFTKAKGPLDEVDARGAAAGGGGGGGRRDGAEVDAFDALDDEDAVLTVRGFLIIREPVAPVNSSVTPTDTSTASVAFFCQSIFFGGSVVVTFAGGSALKAEDFPVSS